MKANITKELFIDGQRLEDVLATDELFLNYFNEFLSLSTFQTALFFNKDTGWFEIVDGAKKQLTKTIKAAVRASQRQSNVYKAVKHHSFKDLPLIPLEENLEEIIEEINTSYNVVTLNKEQGLRWIKEKRFPAFLRSDLYVEYRLAKIISQTQDDRLNSEQVTLKLDYTPHPIKIRPEDVVEEEVDDSPILMKNMCVCMGNSLPTVTEAFLSTARMLEGSLTTSSSDDRPISSLLRPDSGLGGSDKMADDTSEEDVSVNSRLFVTPPVTKTPRARSSTPRPKDRVCVTADTSNAVASWRQPVRGNVYVSPKSENDSPIPPPTPKSPTLPTLETLGNEKDIVFQSVDELSNIITGTVLKYLLAEFNNGQPETYAHHKAVRDLVADEKHRDYSMVEMDNFCCDWVIDASPRVISPKPPETPKKKLEPQFMKPKKPEESDVDSVLGSDDDYEPGDTHFRQKKTRRYHQLTCKKGIEDFKRFLVDTSGERNWYLWCDIDRTRLLDDCTRDEKHSYLEAIRNTYHKKGAEYELSLGMKRGLGLVESPNWTIDNLISLQNEIATPLLLYWAPKYVLKTQATKKPTVISKEYNQQKKIRIESARRRVESHPEPRALLLPFRPKTCKPSLRTQEARNQEFYDAPTPKDFLWQPPESVQLPQTSHPIGRRRTYATKSVEISQSHAGGKKQREEHDYHQLTRGESQPCRRPSRPQSATTFPSNARNFPRERPSTATGVMHSSTVKSTTMSVNSHLVNESVSSGQLMESFSPERRSPEGRTEGEISDHQSELSEFEGGKRMSALLAALNHENKSGLFFHRYIQATRNQIWLACVKFWSQLQEYHKLFYSKVLNHYLAYKKAREIHSQHIVISSPHFIGVSGRITQSIEASLSPPFEELFDDAEIYSLEILLQAWISMNNIDQELLEKVQKKTITRNLETKSKIVVNLQRRGFLRPGDMEPDDDPMENFEDPTYDESLMEEVPEDFRDFTLEKIVRTPIHLENFRQFLQSHFATMDLSCWMDIETFRRIDPNAKEEADRTAKEIKQKYFNKKYFFGPNSPGTKEGLDGIMKSIGGWGKIFPDRPANDLIIGAHDFVRDRLEQKWLPMFLASEQFADLIRPPKQMVDAAEALLLGRQRRSQRLMRMLESKWVSSSNEIISFRRSLLNPVISYQFQRFVSIKSDLLENDVLFWRECQKYKHLHHQHTDDSFVQQKINVIISCFIDTQMATPLQIDIPQEQADRMLEKKRELGPYIFREAQLTVFRVLFEHWAEFCSFKADTTTEQILPTIERKRRRAKLKERKRQKEIDEQQEKTKPAAPIFYISMQRKKKENARRRALGLPIDGEDVPEVDPFTAPSPRPKDSEEKSDKGDAPDNTNVSWSYSHYLGALDKEEIVNKTSEDTFSCLSSEMTGDGKPVPPQVDVSDIKDLKAPKTESVEETETVKPDKNKKSRKSADQKAKKEMKGVLAKPDPGKKCKSAQGTPTKPNKSVTLNLEHRPGPKPVTYKQPVKRHVAMARDIPPLISKP